MKFKIEENSFDSGVIAPKVGNLTLEDFRNLKKEDEKLISEAAQQNNYNLIVLSSLEPVELNGFSYVGVIHEVEADINQVWKNIENIPSLFKVKELDNSNWNEVKELLDIYPPNRYSKDIKIKKETVLEHKLTILKHLANTYPKYSLGLFSKENKLEGFHFLRITSDDLLFLQELLVKPTYRIGFAPLQLVKDNIKSIKDNTTVTTLATRFYENNLVSMNFFNRLGFTKLRKKEYYYHMWV